MTISTAEVGSEEYGAATSPHNPITPQHPALVARPSRAAEVTEIVRDAAARGLRVVPQASGHGAGAPVGPSDLLLDTSALNAVAIDVGALTAVVGAGATWQDVNGAAFRHGLLGRAGSSLSVSVCGYHFGGGIGWLVRPYGMASAALNRVEYVDGSGAMRTATADAVEEIDREAMFAFRGGGGVGIATELEFTLVPVADLHAGFLLWPAADLDAVVGAWADTVEHVGEFVATSIGLLRLPDAPQFPAALRGKQVVHLAVAETGGGSGAAVLLQAVRVASAPAVDTWGPADLEKLGGVHLDPPPGTPARGVARWLTADGPAVAVAVLRAGVDSPLGELEIRSVGSTVQAVEGAETGQPGPFLLHAVGAPSEQVPMPALQAAFDRVLSAAATADTGRSAGSWVEGAASVPDALPETVRTRVRAAADRVDPMGTLMRSRSIA